MSTIRIVLLYLLYIVIIGGITTAIVLSLHSDSHPKSTAKQATSQSNQGKQHASVSRPSSSAAPEQTAPTASASNSSQSSGTGSPAQSSAGAASASAGSAAGQSLAGSNQLVNTGPGDVVGLFVGATVVGVLVHRRLLMRA